MVVEKRPRPGCRSAFAALALLALAASSLTGCGLTKNMDEMHDSTAEMATTTKQMNDKMDKLAAMSDQMATMNAQMLKMIEAMTHMSAGMDAMQSTMTQMVTLMGQMTEMNQSMKQMHAQMDTMISTLGDMNKQMAVMPQMNDTLTAVKGVITRVNTMLASLDKKMDTLPKMDEKLGGMSTELAGMRAEIKGQLAGISSDLGILDHVSDMLDKTNTAITDVSTTLADTQTDIHGVSGKIDHMDKTITNLGINASHAVAAGIRASQDVSIKNSDSLSAKFPEAQTYLYAYDYQQVFRGVEEVGQATEDSFRVLAVQDFMFKIEGWSDPDRTIDLAMYDQKQMNLFAYAGAADGIDPNTWAKLSTLDQTKRPYDYLSMWDMIEYALQCRAAVVPGKCAAEAVVWEQQVLIHEQTAVYVAQLRENVAAAVAVKTLEGFGDNIQEWSLDSMGRGWTVFKDEHQESWDADALQKLKSKQLSDLSDTLAMSIEAKRFLVMHGYKTRFDSTAETLLKKCKILEDKATPADPERAKLLSQIQGLLKKLTE